MPSPEGKLSDQELIQVWTTLREKWGKNGRPACRSCGENEYFLHPELMANRSDSVEAYGRHTRRPAVAVYCKNCGLMEFYAANVLGLEVREVTKKDDGGKDG